MKLDKKIPKAKDWNSDTEGESYSTSTAGKPAHQPTSHQQHQRWAADLKGLVQTPGLFYRESTGCKYASMRASVAGTLAGAYACPKATSVVIPALKKWCNNTGFVAMLKSSSIFHRAGGVGCPHVRQQSPWAGASLWFLLPAQENGEGDKQEIKDSQSTAEKYQ